MRGRDDLCIARHLCLASAAVLKSEHPLNAALASAPQLTLQVCQDAAQLRHRRQARLNAEAGAYQRAAVQPPAQQRMA